MKRTLSWDTGLSHCLFVSLSPSPPDSQRGVASGSVMECRLQTFTQGQAQTPDLSEGTRDGFTDTGLGKKSCVGVIVQLWPHSFYFSLLVCLWQILWMKHLPLVVFFLSPLLLFVVWTFITHTHTHPCLITH